MKNLSLAFGSLLVCLLSACSSTSAPNPPPTVTVAPEATAAPTAAPSADKPVEETNPDEQEAETPPDPPGGGRLAFQQCSEESRKVKGCTKEMVPVCGEVDTGIRCVRAPCPSTAQQTFSNACMACQNPKTRGYWAISCESMTTTAAP